MSRKITVLKLTLLACMVLALAAASPARAGDDNTIAGNIIDLGVSGEVPDGALRAAVEQALAEPVHGLVDDLRDDTEGARDILFLADNGACAEELTAEAAWVRSITPERTRAGRPVHPGNDPAVMPGPDTTYQSYGIPWANTKCWSTT